MFVEPIKNNNLCLLNEEKKRCTFGVLSSNCPYCPLTSTHLTWSVKRLPIVILFPFTPIWNSERERGFAFLGWDSSREKQWVPLSSWTIPLCFWSRYKAQSDSLSYIYFFTININFYTWLVIGLDSIFNLLELDSTKIVIKRLYLRFLMVEIAEPMSFFFVTVSFCI